MSASNNNKPVAECKHGKSCVHLAAGTCKFRHVGAGNAKAQTLVKVHASPKMKLTHHAVLHMARAVYAKRRMFETASAAAAKVAAVEPSSLGGQWYNTDVKGNAPSAELVKLYQAAHQADLMMAKAALASAFGSTPVKFVLPLIANVASSTITTGVVAAANNILVTSSPEFTSLSALFDEYRHEGGRLEYSIVAPTNTVVLGTSSVTGQAMPAIGFDASDSTVPTATTDIIQLEYHQQLAPRMIATATAGTYVGVFGRNDNKPFSFSWRLKDTAAFTGDGGAVGPGQWKSTQGNVANFPDGCIKFYFASGHTTAVVCVVGTHYWNVLFRART